MENYHCPKCHKYVSPDDGYYDSDTPEVSLEDGEYVACFCNKSCANKFHKREEN